MLEGKLALVTGGTRSIGRAIVAELLAQGANVIGTGSKPGGNVPSGADYMDVQLNDPASVDAFCAAIAGLEPDILVNNAGISSPATIEQLDLNDLCRLHQINLLAPIQICKAVVPAMKRKRWGRIINITAGSGYYARKARVNYGSSKSGLEAMSACLAAELIADGIQVNSVAPGSTMTELLRELYSDEQLVEIKRGLPIGEFGSPEEIASLVAWLAAPGRYVTGQQLHVDGAYGRYRKLLP